MSLEEEKLFTKLDLSQAYNQLLLNKQSQLMCSWSTHIGVFKVKRLPFGIKTTAAIFQTTIENLLRGIPHVVVYQDDITVTGPDTKSLLSNLETVLTKLQSVRLKLNNENCIFFQNQKCYYGSL